MTDCQHLVHPTRSSVSPKPTEFISERHLGGNSEVDPSPITFGLGHRVCPRIDTVNSSVFIETAMTLAAFNIADKDSNVIEPKFYYSDGTIGSPKLNLRVLYSGS